MSWQAMTAVSRHSKQEGQLLRLILHLAEFADTEGNVDPAPNQGTLAAHFGCTPRTIRNRLNELTVHNELMQTRIGSGPGNPSAYKILLPMPETAVPDTQKAETKGGKAETKTDFVSTFQQQKAETKGGKATRLKVQTIHILIRILIRLIQKQQQQTRPRPTTWPSQLMLLLRFFPGWALWEIEPKSH